jgi:hypothetical protein
MRDDFDAAYAALVIASLEAEIGKALADVCPSFDEDGMRWMREHVQAALDDFGPPLNELIVVISPLTDEDRRLRTMRLQLCAPDEVVALH